MINDQRAALAGTCAVLVTLHGLSVGSVWRQGLTDALRTATEHDEPGCARGIVPQNAGSQAVGSSALERSPWIAGRRVRGTPEARALHAADFIPTRYDVQNDSKIECSIKRRPRLVLLPGSPPAWSHSRPTRSTSFPAPRARPSARRKCRWGCNSASARAVGRTGSVPGQEGVSIEITSFELTPNSSAACPCGGQPEITAGDGGDIVGQTFETQFKPGNSLLTFEVPIQVTCEDNSGDKITIACRAQAVARTTGNCNSNAGEVHLLCSSLGWAATTRGACACSRSNSLKPANRSC